MKNEAFALFDVYVKTSKNVVETFLFNDANGEEVIVSVFRKERRRKNSQNLWESKGLDKIAWNPQGSRCDICGK